eukprot:UN06044
MLSEGFPSSKDFFTNLCVACKLWTKEKKLFDFLDKFPPFGLKFDIVAFIFFQYYSSHLRMPLLVIFV